MSDAPTFSVKAEHTPTPWYLDGYKHPDKGSPHGVRIQSSRGDGFEYRVAMCPKHPGIDRAQAEANAAFIVDAVNSYDAMRAKLDAARKALEEIAASYSTPPGTIDQCQVHVSSEFQRRMDVAATALAQIAQQGKQ